MNSKKALRIAAAVAALGVAGACSSTDGFTGLFAAKPKPAAPVVNWEKTDTGVVVSPTAGSAHKVRLEVMTDSIIHVTASPIDAVALTKSLLVRAAPSGAKFDTTVDGEVLSLKTAKLAALVSLKTGEVKFLDSDGKPVLSSAGSGEFTPV